MEKVIYPHGLVADPKTLFQMSCQDNVELIMWSLNSAFVHCFNHGRKVSGLLLNSDI